MNDFELAHLNLKDTIKHRIKNIKGGRIIENDNYMLYTIGEDSTDAHLNGVLVFNDEFASNIIEAAEKFFKEYNFDYSFWIRDGIDINLERNLLNLGIEPKKESGSPVMVIDKRIKNIELASKYSLEKVDNLKKIEDFKTVINNSFEKKSKISDLVFSSSTLLNSNKVQAFIIYNNINLPVSAAITSITQDTSGIYYVGTIESERGKGLGKAIVEKSTNEGFERGKNKVILQASDLGEFVYDSLGYNEISTYKIYTVKKGRKIMDIADYKEVLDFWFDPEHVPLHFDENKDFDRKIKSKFLKTWEAGAEGLLVGWRRDIRGRLAEIIVLDQFSRNLWRNNIKTYTQDKMAIVLAQEAINHQDYDKLTDDEKRFILLPFMHSESIAVHDWAEKYYNELGDKNLNHYEKLHRDVLEQFGRYPYQNKDLGRKSTKEELKVLEERKNGFYS